MTFEMAHADDFYGSGYDLVYVFDSLHDMGRSVDGARYAASALAENGTLLVVEPFARNSGV